jgi:hypothetical protein
MPPKNQHRLHCFWGEILTTQSFGRTVWGNCIDTPGWSMVASEGPMCKAEVREPGAACEEEPAPPRQGVPGGQGC